LGKGAVYVTPLMSPIYWCGSFSEYIQAAKIGDVFVAADDLKVAQQFYNALYFIDLLHAAAYTLRPAP